MINNIDIYKSISGIFEVTLTTTTITPMSMAIPHLTALSVCCYDILFLFLFVMCACVHILWWNEFVLNEQTEITDLDSYQFINSFILNINRLYLRHTPHNITRTHPFLIIRTFEMESEQRKIGLEENKKNKNTSSDNLIEGKRFRWM